MVYNYTIEDDEFLTYELAMISMYKAIINNLTEKQDKLIADIGIDITDNTITAKVDETTIKIDDLGRLALAVSALQDSETF